MADPRTLVAVSKACQRLDTFIHITTYVNRDHISLCRETYPPKDDHIGKVQVLSQESRQFDRQLGEYIALEGELCSLAFEFSSFVQTEVFHDSSETTLMSAPVNVYWGWGHTLLDGLHCRSSP